MTKRWLKLCDRVVLELNFNYMFFKKTFKERSIYGQLNLHFSTNAVTSMIPFTSFTSVNTATFAATIQLIIEFGNLFFMRAAR